MCTHTQRDEWRLLMGTRLACTLRQLGDSQLWLRTMQPHQPLTGLIALAVLMMGLLETSTRLPAPVHTWQVSEKAEMLGSRQAKACSRVQGLQLWVWQPPGNGRRGSRCGSTSAALCTMLIIPIRLAASPLWAVSQCQWRRIASSASRKWRKKVTRMTAILFHSKPQTTNPSAWRTTAVSLFELILLKSKRSRSKQMQPSLVILCDFMSGGGRENQSQTSNFYSSMEWN